MHRSKLCLLFILLIMPATLSCAKENPEETAILAVVQSFFDSMTDKNAAAAEKTLLPEGNFYSVRYENSTPDVRNVKHREFIEMLRTLEQDYVERMWNPEVLVHDRIAIVWTKYDFHIDSEYSHGGIDAFSMIKTGEGWKIAGLIYTVEPDGFEKNPDGPVTKK